MSWIFPALLKTWTSMASMVKGEPLPPSASSACQQDGQGVEVMQGGYQGSNMSILWSP